MLNKESDLEGSFTWARIPALPLTRCRTQGKVFNFFKTQFYLCHWNNNHLIEVLRELEEIILLKHLACAWYAQSINPWMLVIVVVVIVALCWTNSGKTSALLSSFKDYICCFNASAPGNTVFLPSWEDRSTKINFHKPLWEVPIWFPALRCRESRLKIKGPSTKFSSF